MDVAKDGGVARALDVRYPYAYVACTSRGLRVVDLASHTEVLPGASTSGPAVDVKLDGNLAFVACGSAGLDVFDISNPVLPVRVGQFPGAQNASVVYLDGGYAYVACGGQGLAILAINYVAAGLGQAVVQAGTSGAVPINLVSYAALTNLAFQVSYPSDRFTNPSLTITSPLIIGARLSQIGPDLLEVSLDLAGSSVPGALTNIGTLNLTAVANQPSAFVTLGVGNVVGRKPDGSFASRGPCTSGRVVVVGGEPLLEMVNNADGSRRLLLYSLPGYRVQVLSGANLAASQSWPLKYDVVPASLCQSIGPLQMTNRMEFFRARR